MSAVARAAFFFAVGVAVFSHRLLVDPSHDFADSQTSWWYVLAFSGLTAVIGADSVVLARAAGPRTFRSSLAAASGAGCASVANILEDGLGMAWAFFATVVGTGLFLLGLLATAVVTALEAAPRRRLLALVPAGTVVAIVLYVEAGGPIMLATWLLAAVLVLRPPMAEPAADGA